MNMLLMGGRAQSRIWRVPPVHDHAPHGAASLGRLLLALLLVFSTGQYPSSCHGNGGHGGATPGVETVGGGKCMEREREALLAVRDDVWVGTDGDLQPLPSWERDVDCCRWKGVACDHRSGHVVKLDLRWSYPYGSALESSKVNPSLLNLGSLRYLDLSGNYFFGSPLPSFIGSLVNLEYLNISNTYFAGSVPLELGNLQNLKSLDLSSGFSSSNTIVENLGWLSHLSHLQYLDMSGLNLSAAHDWLQVISILPSLSVLRLQYCDLPSTPPSTVLPLGNFTSLSTLDLGGHSLAYSTWPLWLSNISSLTTLVLSNQLNCAMPPEAFKNVKHLEVLTMYGFWGPIPRSLWRLDQLKLLVLSGDDLRIGSSKDMGHLSSMRELTLSGVVGRLPDSLGNIMGLQSLSIESDVTSIYTHADVTKYIELPKSISNLSRLEHLEVRAYDKGGWLPESIGKLVGLKTLMVSGFNTSEEVLRNMGDLCNLTKLTIEGNKADGAEVTKLLEGLSECVGGSALEELNMRWNGYRGHLPDQLGKLKNLQYLDLSGNSIVGSIPASIGELESLSYLLLSYNSIDGSIPASIGELESLSNLDLSYNQLSGLVPSSIGKLSNLTSMYISSNRLEGELSEAHFSSHQSHLDYVDLSHNAALSLNTSQTWIPPFQLSVFDMSACHVGPEFPRWLQTQKKLNWLDLSSNNISYSLEDDFFNKWSNKLAYFNLSHNDIKGILPASLFSAVHLIIDLSFNSLEASPLVLNVSSEAIHVSLSHNLISGPIFVDTGGVENGKLLYLDLSHNTVQGSIPSAICQIGSLVVLDLSHNHFSDQLPNCWKGGDLVVMKFSNNSLVGHIPSSIGMLSNLELLHLDKNALTGSIPSSLKKCTSLKTLDLSENNLSGEIPSWLGQSLSSLRILSLRSNMFHGYLPMSLSGLQSLKILDLAYNNLLGSILLSFHNLTEMVKIEKPGPATYEYNIFENMGAYNSVREGNLSSGNYMESKNIVPKGTELQYTVNLPFVTMIDLSSNNFSGQFPREITNLHGLHFLNLSNNHLSGGIPENISTMGLLESLDLSFNQLSGSVPSTMSTMHFLSFLNMSYNFLSGRIPKGQIQTFDQYSFVGNHDLCGAPILGPCPEDATFPGTFQAGAGGFDTSHDEHESHMAWFYVSLGPGFVTGFLGFLGVFSLMRRSWRIAYFRFFDSLGDTLYVFVAVRYARLKVKLSAWRGGGSSG